MFQIWIVWRPALYLKSCNTFQASNEAAGAEALTDSDFEALEANGLRIKPSLSAALEHIIAKDCAMLARAGSTDYSLLLGIHYVKKGEPFDDAVEMQSGKAVVLV